MAAPKKTETRDAFGEALVRMARADKNIVALDCDLGRSTRSQRITEVDPGRFFDMGIAEQDMISTAAGMARMGKTVFVNSFAIFITGRAFDQIRQQVALPKSNVKVCGSSAGLTQGADGATHQSVVDLALMRSLPHMAVVVPADAAQTEQVVEAACRLNGPMYIRLSRYATPPCVPPETEFQIGRAQVLRTGKQIVLCACGPILHNALAAADLLAAEGLHVGVCNFHTIKPLDVEAVHRLAETYRWILTVEENSILGGLGSAVAEAMAERGGPARLHRLGVQDTFGESGTADELLAKHELDAAGIAVAVRRLSRSHEKP